MLPLLLACVTDPAPPAAAIPVVAATAGAAPVAAAAPVAPPAWPAADAPLRVLEAPPVRGALLLDAGHGAEGNPGNTNWRCESEADVMRRVADGVHRELEMRGVTTGRTRPDAGLVSYDARLRASASADWFVSLHSDSRAGQDLRLDPATGCYTNTGAPGFAVLWSDEGEAGLVSRRARLARAIALRMAEAGFHPYEGFDYEGLYEGEATPGVFVDRHTPRKRIRLLRRPKVPSVIVETHQAWDREEATRWEEPRTFAAFAAALAAALADMEG